MDVKKAIAKINAKGMLLVFPINNKREPSSLWYEFFPRTEMRWEWDEGGDQRVSDLWHLREKISRSGKVVYTKWFRGRATVISLELFPALLRVTRGIETAERRLLGFNAKEILDLLDEDSPLSTKALKRAADLQGRENERVYNASTKELWSQCLIVGFGEVDEGAFPSLAVGSTRVLFEECWKKAAELELEDAWEIVDRFLPKGSSFRKYCDSIAKAAAASLEVEVDLEEPADEEVES